MDKRAERYPQYIKDELKKLNEAVAAETKKFLRYRLWSLPLVIVSLLNLFFILVPFSITTEQVPLVFFYALAGAIGMALSKEAKHQQQEMQAGSEAYMVSRIENSSISASELKEEYSKRIKTNSEKAIDLFIEFLKKERKQGL